MRNVRKFFCLMMLFALCSQANAAYVFRALDGLWGNPTDINSSGAIIGSSYQTSSFTSTLWSEGGITYPGRVDSTHSYGVGINNSGRIALNVHPLSLSSSTAYAGISGALVKLDSLNSISSYAIDLNERGNVVGWTGDGNGGQTKVNATVWEGGVARILRTASTATAINDAGQAVGYDNTSSYLWDGSETLLLGSLGGRTTATDINNLGQVIGYGNTLSNAFDSRAIIWEGGVARDLGALSGTVSYALAINDRGQIVGKYRADLGEFRAAIWGSSGGIDLNELLDDEPQRAGWVLRSANSINANGWIAGQADNVQLGIYGSAYLLSTSVVPEPNSLALVLTGLFSFFVVLRKRGVPEMPESSEPTRTGGIAQLPAI